MRSISVLFLLSLASALYITSADYSKTDALEFATISALSYCDSSDILSWTCGPPCQNLTGYEVYFTQLFNVSVGESLAFTMVYSSSQKRFVTAFRGSQGSFEILLEVLEGEAMAYPNLNNSLVDDYFYTHYNNILRPVFFTELQHAIADYKGYEFIFTGHSLGAAFTALGAYDAVTSGLLKGSDIQIYNYGMPRLGNIVLAQAIEAAIPTIFRVVHWKDIVPHVPPCLVNSSNDCVSSSSEASPTSRLNSIAWAAWHVTTQIFYNEANTDYTVCSGAEDPKCADQFSLAQTSVNDHHYYMGIGLFCHGNGAFGPVPSEEMLIM